MKLDKKGLEELDKKIKECERKRKAAMLRVGEEATLTSKENSAFEDAKQQVNLLNKEITDLRNEQAKVEIVKAHGHQDRIDVGDVVTVYNKQADDRFEVRLVASYDVNLYAEVEEASINSPLGEALYGKKKGDVVKYSVENRDFAVCVEEISKTQNRSLN